MCSQTWPKATSHTSNARSPPPATRTPSGRGRRCTSASPPALLATPIGWKPASAAALSAWYTLRLFEEAGLPPGVINLVYGPGSEIGEAALAHRELAGVHFTGSTPVFQSMWKTVGDNIANYRNYPRIVGETGGKDFIVAHPSADAEAVATAIVRGSFEYQGQKCSAASRIFAPSNLC